MLKQRIITALLLIPFVLAGIFYLPLNYFGWALIPIFMLAAREWGKLIDAESPALHISFAISIGILLGALNWIVPPETAWFTGQLNPIYQSVMLLGCLWWILATVLVCSYPKSAKLWQPSPMLKSIFGQLTLIPCFVALNTLKGLSTIAQPFYGGALILVVFLIVWAADTGAYFFGKRFGKHKMMPNVSPAKTIEGLLGGLLTTMIVVGLVMWLSPEQELMLLIGVTLVTAIASALGDLAESMFKRSACLKDSGSILPGHGGVLDRIDSLTAALPVFAMLYLTFWM